MSNDERGKGDISYNPYGAWGKGSGHEDVRTVKSGHASFYKHLPASIEDRKTGTPDIFKEALEKTAYGIVDLVYSKHKDYGPAGIIDAPYGPLNGIITRLHDKLARAVNLSKKTSLPNNESLKDTFIDIVGYGLIAITLLDKNFPEK